MNKHEGSDFKKWSNEFVEELARENEKMRNLLTSCHELLEMHLLEFGECEKDCMCILHEMQEVLGE